MAHRAGFCYTRNERQHSATDREDLRSGLLFFFSFFLSLFYPRVRTRRGQRERSGEGEDDLEDRRARIRRAFEHTRLDGTNVSLVSLQCSFGTFFFFSSFSFFRPRFTWARESSPKRRHDRASHPRITSRACGSCYACCRSFFVSSSCRA